jgi:hypothetical protein
MLKRDLDIALIVAQENGGTRPRPKIQHFCSNRKVLDLHGRLSDTFTN